jgi:hypothetical protein
MEQELLNEPIQKKKRKKKKKKIVKKRRKNNYTKRIYSVEKKQHSQR